MISVVKARLVSATNERVQKYVGEIFHCRMHNKNQFLMDNGQSYILTSVVKEYEQKDEKIIIKTLNSVYELEIIA